MQKTRRVTIQPPLARQVTEIIRRNKSVTTRPPLAGQVAGIIRRYYGKRTN